MYNRRQFIKKIGIGAGALALFSKTQRVLAQEVDTIRVGYQSCDPLDLLRNSDVIKKFPGKVSWSQFVAGPPLVQALLAGSIDVGEVGDTPPIFAQSASNNFVYIAQEPPSPDSEAIIVHQASNIHDLAGLKGKKNSGNTWIKCQLVIISSLKKSRVIH